MNVWEYMLCLCCALSSVGFMRQAFDDALQSAPLSVAPREVLLVLTVPATMGLFALPVYAFLIMPWWQPVVGFVLAMWIAHLLNDRLFAGTKHPYSWAIAFSMITALIFVVTVLP